MNNQTNKDALETRAELIGCLSANLTFYVRDGKPSLARSAAEEFDEYVTAIADLIQVATSENTDSEELEDATLSTAADLVRRLSHFSRDARELDRPTPVYLHSVDQGEQTALSAQSAGGLGGLSGNGSHGFVRALMGPRLRAGPLSFVNSRMYVAHSLLSSTARQRIKGQAEPEEGSAMRRTAAFLGVFAVPLIGGVALPSVAAPTLWKTNWWTEEAESAFAATTLQESSGLRLLCHSLADGNLILVLEWIPDVANFEPDWYDEYQGRIAYRLDDGSVMPLHAFTNEQHNIFAFDIWRDPNDSLGAALLAGKNSTLSLRTEEGLGSDFSIEGASEAVSRTLTGCGVLSD